MTKSLSETTFKNGGRRKAILPKRPTVRLRCYRCGKLLNRYVPMGAKDKSKAYCMECA